MSKKSLESIVDAAAEAGLEEVLVSPYGANRVLVYARDSWSCDDVYTFDGKASDFHAEMVARLQMMADC